MTASTFDDSQTRSGGASGMAIPPAELDLSLIAERMVLGALREQDTADAAEHARQRAQFLADASLRFGASLDVELTYAAISGIALTGLDAWCVVDVVEAGGGLRRLAVLHPDEDKQAMARALAGRWVPASDDIIGVPAVRRDMKPVMVPYRPDDDVANAAGDAETRRVLRWLGAGNMLVQPITGQGVLLGAVTFVARPNSPAYTADDLELARALAERCAQAIESAQVYAAARAAWAEAEAARAAAEAARAEAAMANESKAHFLRTMSHELRTPLNAIAGYAQLLEMGIRGPVTPEQKADLASIQRSQVHLLGLVDAVLNYVQISAGRVLYATTVAPFCEVVESAYALTAPQMKAKGLTYEFVRCDASLEVNADEGKVRQIVLNLLGNATKFTPRGGCITVTCGELPPEEGSPAMLFASVTDTGVGIPPEELEHVFDPFVQVDRRLTSPDIGVGLGLAISRDLARGMKGDLTVRSVPHVGSTFTLTLPRA